MLDWNDLGRWVYRHELSSKTWISERRSLLAIFLEAMNMGIPPEIASPCFPDRLSHLRTIIRPAKDAITAQNRDQLIDLLYAASTMTVKELRLYLGTPRRQVIRFDEFELLGLPTPFFQLTLSQDQFDRVRNTTELQYVFLPREEERAEIRL